MTVKAGGPDGRRARWAQHREDRRAELVDAAIAAIERHGPSLGMDDIAAEAGVTKPVIYRYFTDKADLYLAVGQRMATGLLNSVNDQLQGGRHPKANVAAAIDAYLHIIDSSPQVYRFVVHRPFLDRPAGRDLVHDYEGLVAAAVARIIGEQLRAAGLDSGGAEPWAAGVVGCVRAAGDWWLERQSMSRADLTAYLVRLVWGGLESLNGDEVLTPGGAGEDGRAGVGLAAGDAGVGGTAARPPALP
ncbi:MAG TPA: TetR/AcrR family transcriptional regulator [Mycobacteriales bacterium]|nr:TetR/AcrR family transcriptional regulator [Mycobacteriales bacterium]